ncbi:MAG TPA: cupin domain-containing protein [Candidatus Sulfotelmatobacter sp.]|jgi:quercetin dioxygenase-like cupin family protein|nr:cupin domain-containing protein [Candidatus Sulfotelmatobacter sp.]
MPIIDVSTLPTVIPPGAPPEFASPALETDDFVLAITEIPAGASGDMHTHPGDQVEWLWKGRGRITVEGDEPFEVEPGQVWHVPAGVRHTGEALTDCTVVALILKGKVTS